MRVRIRSLRKTYKTGDVQTLVLRNVNLTVESGDFIAITGPSGAGKSTLLMIIGCLEQPDVGDVFLDDLNIVELSETERQNFRLQKIGFVFQSFYLLSSLTAIENVALPMKLLGKLSKGEIYTRAMELLRAVNLEDKAYRVASELSGGEQQRVAIARALANDPSLILADEPTGNLDTENAKAILEIFANINEQHKKTIIVVTHDSRVASYAKKIYYITDGIIRSTIW